MRTRSLLTTAFSVVIASTLLAQRGPAPDPLVKEGVTVKLAPHTYEIPDGSVGLVPNVGIVVGSRATLVIDPGLGRRNGETVLREVAKVSKNTELYIASTHFHPEHTTGYVAFPDSAKYINSKTQEAEFEESGMQMVKMFSGRSATTADILKDAARRPAVTTFDRDYSLDLGGVRVRFILVGPTHTKGDTAVFVEGDSVLFAGDVVMNNSFLAASPGIEHEGMADGVRYARGAQAEDDRAGAWGGRARNDHRQQPGDHGGSSSAGASAQGGRTLGRRRAPRQCRPSSRRSTLTGRGRTASPPPPAQPMLKRSSRQSSDFRSSDLHFSIQHSAFSIA